VVSCPPRLLKADHQHCLSELLKYTTNKENVMSIESQAKTTAQKARWFSIVLQLFLSGWFLFYIDDGASSVLAGLGAFLMAIWTFHIAGPIGPTLVKDGQRTSVQWMFLMCGWIAFALYGVAVLLSL